MSSLVMNTPLPKHYSCISPTQRPLAAATIRRRTSVQCTTKFLANPRGASTLQDYHFDDPINDNIFKGYFASEYEKKLEKIRDLLVKSRGEEEDDPIGSLVFVDTIQRLGVAGHYRKEIETIMQKHYLKLGDVDFCGFQSSLLDMSLSFRLLRQTGYHVSADVFNNFKGQDGKFRDELKQDVWGLLELFEATHLSFEGENILNEAQHFSSKQLLKHLAENTNYDVVKMRFKHPFHKSIARLNFQRDVRGIDKSITTLTELSEMDFLRGKYDEHQNGADGSYIQCYMNDRPGVSYQQTREHVADMMEREWKQLNKESFNHSTRPIQEAALNLARMVPLMYSYDDNQRLPVLAEYINLMLLSPASLEPDRQNKINSFEFSL
ncbi:hypothetical protein SASPL_153917 [Salvia splendens]|uniref:Terpene synthase N-terminal domain-containing protein n=1 Tax=Salvia splendens TaxID=180675 RepID=A0A8X8YY51_SALSN|nr:hypothetical protein SASPL_153917 [Salvia splendens]